MDQQPNFVGLNSSVPEHISRVYIIILNWNGWRDTIECLESVMRLDYPDYRVIVCDNASSDHSLDHIRNWALGKTAAESKNPALAYLITPRIPKPMSIVEASPATSTGTTRNDYAKLVLIQTGANLGFAGGNNVGLRYALQQGDCEFAWLLNNDTVVDPDALSHLIRRMQERPDAGICGSTLLYYDDPTKVQACGGSVYNKWVARGGHIGKLTDAARLPDAREVEQKMAYVVGASMLVRKAFLEQIGLMDEQYFLYFEELDWAARARDKFSLAYSATSCVYHKEGRSIGTQTFIRARSSLSEFYATRNRMFFTRLHYPEAGATVFMAISLSAMHRLVTGRWTNFSAVIRGASEGLCSWPTNR